MVNTIYKTIQDMIDKIQKLKGKTKLKFYQYISNYYDEMNIRRQSGTFQFKGDVFSEGAQGTSRIYHEVIKFLKFLHTKPQVKNMNVNY